MDYEVVIVGAGPVGLALANLLGRAGRSVFVVERNPTTSDIPKAIVLDDEGARTMSAAGLAEEILQASLRATGSKYYNPDGSLIAEVGAGSAEYGFPKRTYFHQPELEEILHRGLARHASAEIAFSTELLGFSQNAEGVDLQIQPADGAAARNLRCAFLIGCDGARSTVRENLGIAYEGETYDQDWIVLDTENDPLDGAFSRFICDPARPVAIIPAPRGGRRYEFMLLPGEDRAEMLRPQVLEELLAPYRPYRPEDMTRQAVYTFHARIAARWGEGRCLLAGDAAHITPPFAGQGMNAGFRDVDNLCWKLQAILSGLADISILASYEEERRDPCWQMILLAVAMGDVIMATAPEDVAARDRIGQSLARFPEMAEYFLAMKFKPKPRYAGGLFVETDAVPLEGSLVGAMLPNPSVRLADGREARLDEALGSGFALIAQDDTGAEFLRASRELPLLKALAPSRTRVAFAPADEPGPDVPAVTILEPAIAAPIRTHRDQILLIRPDRYVAGAFSPRDTALFCDKFARKLGFS